MFGACKILAYLQSELVAAIIRCRPSYLPHIAPFNGTVRYSVQLPRARYATLTTAKTHVSPLRVQQKNSENEQKNGSTLQVSLSTGGNVELNSRRSNRTAAALPRKTEKRVEKQNAKAQISSGAPVR